MNLQVLGIFLLILLVSLALIYFFLFQSWKKLPLRVRRETDRELASQASTLWLLAILIVFPGVAVILIRLDFLPGIFGPIVLLIWAGLAVNFWQSRAVIFNAPEWDVLPLPRIPGPIVIPGQRPAPVPVPALLDTDLVHKVFTWSYGEADKTWKIEMDLSQGRYNSCRNEDRLPISQWAKYVTADMPEVRLLAAQFQNLHLTQNWCTFEQAANVLSFIQQCIPYSLDEISTPKSEWPRYPIETLMDGTGDCEDVSILLGAVLSRLGFQVALLSYPGHMALGIAGADELPGDYVNDVKRRRRYFYAEGTNEGWHIGEIPPNMRGLTPEILPIEILIDKADKAGIQ